MAKKKAAGVKHQNCDCIEQVDKQLEPYNTKLATELWFNFTTGSSGMVLPVPTRAINPKDRKNKARTVYPSYCVFCGKKNERESTTPPSTKRKGRG